MRAHPLAKEEATADTRVGTRPNARALRVLVIAEAANPEWPSVPLVGWSHYIALRDVVDAHLVTQIRNRDAIRRAGLPESDFTAIDSEAVAGPIHNLGTLLRGGSNKGWTTTAALAPLAYWYFERQVWKAFGARIRAKEFDVVHRITPLTPTLPSPLARKCRRADVPFVLGPINGGLPWPKAFDPERKREKEWLAPVRKAYTLLPGYRSTRENAAAIIAGSRQTLSEIPARWQSKCIYCPENAIDPARFHAPPERSFGLPIRIAFVGRLVPYKGCDMLLEAAADLVREGKVTIDVIGDGPERERLVGMADAIGKSGGVTFSGWLSQEQIAAKLADVHVLGFPSIREFGGGVVLEAMALGVVPIVVDYGGPAELVSKESGFAVPLGTRAEIVRSVRTVLARLAGDPSQLASMSRAGQDRVEACFTWQAKARQALQVYNWVITLGDKPDFGSPLGARPTNGLA